ncbi:SusD/RagB family nutrient-binding outer membrane lipoprotein [Pontibacter sp. G13]|uniref:SusD/RagB family nutrient-binding outer membrane lipoprotein n=1 Tax=Pontibacter sp. G13 TaxID=3074898 RepID=UPI00288BF818|nr:SusD/RagB family nutrient-binding outer membrane lipoprotein [Pontibacter sp. G13]WNJ16839.1 SusD/RagB family nutrient-binding outer membrane lipoprotein [Pontibacter sp. G13]
MKPIKLIHTLLAIVLVVGFSSCEDYFGDVNENPNNPPTASEASMLGQIEGRLVYAIGGDATRYISVYTQHVDGISRQFAVYQDYGIQGVDVNNLWGFSLYAGVLNDIQIVKDLAVENGNNHFLGVAQILEAYTMLFITDNFNDAPYSDAWQGRDQLSPVYDTQDQIYTQVFSLLSEGRANLERDAGLNALANDLIYSTSLPDNLDKWEKFSYLIEARAHLHRAKINSSAYSDALTAVQQSFESNADNAGFQFTNSPTTAAPWYQFNDQRGDIDVGANYVALLSSLNDPRDSVYGRTLDTEHPLFQQEQFVLLASYAEAKFIEAECLFQTSGGAAAEAAYTEGITASFEFVDAQAGTAISDSLNFYLSQTGVDPAGNLTLEQIMTQKYIAMFTDPEVFNDWRRTNIPELTPNSGSQIPRRLPYPEQEINFNTNAPTGVTIFDRVDWDTE